MEPKPAILILTAGTIGDKYQTYSFLFDSPALVPIASRSTLSYILSFYDQFSAVFVAVNADDLPIFKAEFGFYKQITFIEIRHSTGLFDTLSQALPYINTENVIINLGTSIPTILTPAHTVLLSDKLTFHTGYSGVSETGEAVRFIIKNTNPQRSFYAFTGIFNLPTSAVVEALQQSFVTGDLLEVIQVIAQKMTVHFRKTEWIDTGHEINYADARKMLIASRSFNSLAIDPDSGLLIKSSSNTGKLYRETAYITMLPQELQLFYPRIFSNVYNSGKVEMEYYGYPNLSEFQLYRKVADVQWARIFENLGSVLQRHFKHKFSIGYGAFADFYVKKTKERIESYHQSNNATEAIRNTTDWVINGLNCKNYAALEGAIEKRIAGLYREDDFCIMHGDFCFNNILYDIGSNTVKLIDPRGSFGERCVGIYGDIKYDLAKLLHSTTGKYDYIVNSLYTLEEDGNTINYIFPERANQASLERYSIAIVNNLEQKETDILFIVGLLFLSMCPLHADNSTKQRLMYYHGLYFVNKYLQL